MKFADACLALLAAGWGLAAAAQHPPTDVEKLVRLVEAQQQKIDQQQQQLDVQRDELEALKLQLEAIRRAQVPSAQAPALAAVPDPAQVPSGVAASAPTQAAPPGGEAIAKKGDLSQSANAAPRLDNAPIDPEMKGFITIPGTVSRFRIGGYAKLDFIHDFQAAGDPDSFTTSKIPMDASRNAQNTSISARPTKLSLDFRRPTSEGDLRLYFETNLYGSGGSTNFHLTQAYGQVWNILAGYTYSAVIDVDSMPETLDYQGPNSLIYVKQPQIRYTLPLDRAKKHTLAFSLERGTSDIVASVPDPAIAITPTAPWPDGVIRYRYDGAGGHFQAGAVFRSVGGYATGLPDRHVFGWGLNLTGAVLVAGRDSFLYQLSGGEGMGRYAQDVAGLAPDVGIDTQGRLRALPVYAGCIGYQHYWGETLRSNLAYGYLKVDSRGYLYTTDFYRSDYGMVDLIWNPRGTTLNVGVEYLYGDHQVTSGQSAHANRFQFSFQLDMLKLK